MPEPLDPVQNPQDTPVTTAPVKSSGVTKTLEELSAEMNLSNPSVSPGAIEEPEAPSDALARYYEKVRLKTQGPPKPFITLADLGLLAPRAVANTIQGTYNFADDALTGQWLPESWRPGFLKAIHDGVEWKGQLTAGIPVLGTVFGEPESKAGAVLQTLADFGVPFGQVSRGMKAIESAVPVLSKSFKLLGIARDTEPILLQKAAAFRNAQAAADAKGAAEAAKEFLFKARLNDAGARLSGAARMTLDGALTDFIVAPGIRGTPAPGERVSRAEWGAIVGIPFQAGLGIVGRLIRPFIPIAERLPGYPEGGLIGYEAVPPKVAAEIRGKLSPEPFEPGAPLASPGRLMSDEEIRAAFSPREMKGILEPKPTGMTAEIKDPTGGAAQPKESTGLVFPKKEFRGLYVSGMQEKVDDLLSKGWTEHPFEGDMVVLRPPKTETPISGMPVPQPPGSPAPTGREKVPDSLMGFRKEATAIRSPQEIFDEYHQRANVPPPEPPFPGSDTGRVNPRNLTPEQRLAMGTEEGDLNFRGAIGLGRPPINAGRALEWAAKELPTDHIGRTWADTAKDAAEWVARTLKVPFQLLEPVFEGTTPAEIQREIGGWTIAARRIMHGTAKYMSRIMDETLANPGNDHEFAITYAQAGVAVRLVRALKDTLYEMGSALNAQKMGQKPLDVAGVKRIMRDAADKASLTTGDAIEDSRNVFLRAESKMTEAEMRGDTNAVREYIERNGGREAMSKRMKALADLNKPGLDPSSRAQGMVAALEDIASPTFSDFAHETFVAPLFGLGTMSKVALSQFLFGSVMRPLLHSAGGVAAVNIAALTGQPLKSMYGRETVRGLLELSQLFNPSVWKIAAKAGIESTGGSTGGQLLREGKFADVARQPFWTGESIGPWVEKNIPGMSKDNPLVHLASALPRYGGRFLRFFPEALGTIDAVEKQFVAQQIARSHLTLEALMDRHLPLGEVDEYVERRIGDIIRDSKLRTQEEVYREIARSVATEEAASDTPWTDQERAMRVKEVGDPIVKAREKDSGLIDYIRLQARDTAQDAPIPYDTPGGKLLHAAMEIPGAFLFAPVVRNAYNQARLTFQPVDALGLVRAMVAQKFPGVFPTVESGRNAFVREFTSNNPMMRAKALGDAMLAMSMIGGASHFALQTNDKGQPLLTGNGPPDPALAKEWASSLHWQPRSILVGNRYIDYGQLMGPAGTLFGATVDAAQGLYHADEHASWKDRAAMANMLWMAWLTAIRENNALGDLAKPLNALTDPMGGFAGALQQLKGATSIATPVPRVVTEFTQDFPREFGGGDPLMRDVSALWGPMANKIPFLNSTLPPWRNDLGETMKKPHRAFGIFPAFVSEPLSEDPVDVEIKLLGRLGGLSPDHDGIDLRDVKNPQTGQDAFDRWGELLGTIPDARGRNLRTALREHILSDHYAKIAYPTSISGPNLRLDELKAIQDSFKQRAERQVMREMNEWEQAKRNVMLQKKAQAHGNEVLVK